MKKTWLLPLLIALHMPAWAKSSGTACDGMSASARKRFKIAVPLNPKERTSLRVNAELNFGNFVSTGSFIVDTGATYSSISQEAAEALDLDLDNATTLTIATANGRIQVPKITIESLNLNGLEIRNIELTVLPLPRNASYAGMLGLNFLRQFVVTIDPIGWQLLFSCP